MLFQLHLFSDASEIAYAAVGYVRIVGNGGGISCRFTMGKSRNCPIKKPTIPRLELMASVLAVRLSNMIKNELDWNIDSINLLDRLHYRSSVYQEREQAIPPLCGHST